MEGDQQIVPHTHQAVPDYVDALIPGYHFRPTDSELIGYYLKRRIELGENPKGRLYEANVYDHHPKELTGRYRSCDDKWYFFSKKEGKYPKGERENRRTKKIGYWKSTQSEKTVYDPVTAREVGKKRSLVLFDDEDRKTSWLMKEYTYNGNHVNELTDLVLCKMYNKDSTRTIISSNGDYEIVEQVQDTRNKGKDIQQQNENHNEAPPAQRQSVLENPESGALSSSSACPTLVKSKEMHEQHIHNMSATDEDD